MSRARRYVGTPAATSAAAIAPGTSTRPNTSLRQRTRSTCRMSVARRGLVLRRSRLLRVAHGGRADRKTGPAHTQEICQECHKKALERDMREMNSPGEKTGCEAILVEDAVRIRMMGFPVLEALPSRSVP